MERVGEALRAAAAGLGGDEARLEAELLLAHALQRPRSWLYAHAGDELGAETQALFAQLLARRAGGEPVAMITGRRGFWTLDLEVDASTLVPRPETERLVELALERLPADRDAAVLDLGTGTGAIALAIARERPQARVTAVDASAAALAVAGRNAVAHGLRLRLLEGDWFAPVAGERFALIASNPPYIAEDDPHLEQGDLRFEPRTALAAGADGLDDLRRIIADAPAHLEAGGWLLVEHGWDQGAAVRALFAAAGFSDIATAADLEARDRITLGRRAG
jgi:release factor glutamine methyltransferase